MHLNSLSPIRLFDALLSAFAQTLVVFVFCLAQLTALAVARAGDPPAVEWTKTFGGARDDVARSVQQTSDGGYIVAAKVNGGGDAQLHLIKTNASGIVDPDDPATWERTYNGTGFGASVQQTDDDQDGERDDGFVVVSSTDTLGGGAEDVYLLKIDADGNPLWERTFGGASRDIGASVEQTSDGGFVIVGWTDSYGAGGTDIYLIKTDTEGNVSPEDPTTWETTLGGMRSDIGVTVQQTDDDADGERDDGYIIGGRTNSFGAGQDDLYLVKTDSAGNTLWDRTFGGEENDRTAKVRQAIDGGYVVVGTIRPSADAEDRIFFVKTDSEGVIDPENPETWDKTFGRDNGEYSYGDAFQETADGGYVISGATCGPEICELYIVKTDAEGSRLWEKTIYGGDVDTAGLSIQEISDGGYIVAGSVGPASVTPRDIFLLKLGTEPDGEVESFLRGDCNDDGSVDISDASCILNWLFLGGLGLGCLASANTNADSGADISDATYLLNFLFLGGPSPVAPYPDCGVGTQPTDVENCAIPPANCATS